MWSTAHLSLSVDADDAAGALVRRCDEDGVSADPVHVDAGARLNVVQVNVAVFGDEVNHVVLWSNLERKVSPPEHHNNSSSIQNSREKTICFVTHLHRHGEIILRFRREEHVDSFFLIGLVALWRSPDLDDVQLKRAKQRNSVDYIPHSAPQQALSCAPLANWSKNSHVPQNTLKELVQGPTVTTDAERCKAVLVQQIFCRKLDRAF